MAPRTSSLLFTNATATTEIYTLSLPDALPIYLAGVRRARRRHGVGAVENDAQGRGRVDGLQQRIARQRRIDTRRPHRDDGRSEEHTSELQSRRDLVCRLLLEKKKKKRKDKNHS